MKKLYKSLFALFLFIGINQSLTSQVSTYTFSQSNGSYNAISGTTLVAATATTGVGTLDSYIHNIPTSTFPFTFIFNGVGYTGCNISSNGFITFGATVPSAFNSTPISNTALYAGAISAWGGDLNSMFNAGAGMLTGNIQYTVVGTLPNREIVIQYSNWRPSYSISTALVYGIDFQIRLQETTNNISIVYGPNAYIVGAANFTGTRQIGLRGATNADFNNRLSPSTTLFTSSSAGTFNNSTQTFSTTGVTPGMPNNALTYSWVAPPLPLVINSVSVTPLTTQCTAVGRAITSMITPGGSALTNVTLSYSVNGVAQPTIAMTGGNVNSSSTWTGNIPVASPVNANVTWAVSASDGIYLRTTPGTSYQDQLLFGATSTPTAAANPLCAGNSTTLSPIFANPTLAALYTLPPAVSSPMADEDVGNVTFGSLNNTTAVNTLLGTIGLASGTTGSYSDFTAFGPYNFTAGTTYVLNVSSIQTGGSFANGFGVYIDYNRNGQFTDIGEAVYVSTVTIAGNHTETANITIPLSARNGLTRMRVICNEGLVSGPTMFVNYGEYEEYMLNISSSNPGGGLLPSFASFAWSDGLSTIATTSTTIISPVSNTTYSLLATDVNGCAISSTLLTVTVTPTPANPTAFNSSQCGLGIPTASVSGGTSYNWYATPSSTLILQAGSSQTFTTAINSTTSYYVTSNAGLCESARVTITTLVTNSDPITATATPTAVCPGQTFTLTAASSGTNSNVYSYTWTPTPVAGSGMAASVAGNTVNVTPTTIGTYNYKLTAVDGVCTTTTSINVMLNAPPVLYATATPTMVCSGSTVNLTAASVTTGTSTIGTGSVVSTSQPSPYYTIYWGNKNQYLILASELTAAGYNTGNITSLGLNVGSVSTTLQLTNFYISMKSSTLTALTSAFETGLSTVYNSPSYSITPFSFNNHVFSTPFNWDGVSNIVIETCFNNNAWNGSQEIYYSTTPFVSAISAQDDNATVCSSPGFVTTSSNRPNLILGGLIVSSSAASINWQWNPGAINSNTTIVSPINSGTVANTQGYTVTATSTVTGCSNTASVSVVVNPIPVTPTAFNAIQCGLGVPTASLSGGTSYIWYAAPTSTTVLQAGTSSNYTTAINATTTWYVTSFNGNCESPRVAVTQTVTVPDPITATSTSSAVCPGQSFSLTAASTGTTNVYTYSWISTPSAGSGITGSVSGSSVVVTPTTSGTYVYMLTGVAGICTATTSITVSLNSLPVVNASTTPTMICSGGTVNLVANNIISGSQVLPTGYCSTTNSGSSCITALSINTLNRSSLCEAGFYIDVPVGIATTSLIPGSSYNFSIDVDASAITSVWFDWNRNGIFEASEWTQPYTSGITGNASITVPLSASSGITKMRVRSRATGNTNGAIDACSSFGSGETEDYTINILTDGSASLTWQWNPGAINSNTTTVSPINSGTVANTQGYTVTATSTVTGCSNTASVSVVVNPIPATPTAFNSSQCGFGVSTATISGGTSYKWYAAPTSTTVLQAGSSSNFTTAINATTTWYVASFNGNCESPRVALTQTVTTPDAITASISSATICPNTTATLTAVKSGTLNTYTYSWIGSPVGSGIATSLSGGTVVITPTLSGTFVYTVTGVDGVCASISTITLVTFNAVTTPPTAFSTPNPLCAGNTATLSAMFAPTSTIMPTYTLFPSFSNPMADEDLGNITFGPLDNTTLVNDLNGTIGTATGIVGGYSDFTSFGPFSYNIGNTYTLSLSSVTTGFAYNNGFGVYADYNRNGSFLDAGEAVYNSAFTTSGAHTETVIVTIPVTASTGLTRLRVISNEGLVTDPNQTMFYGEYEEYTISLIPALTYNWTNGVSSVGTTNPLPVTPTVSTTYSFTATDGNGCMINSTAVTVTVNPIPTVTAVASTTNSCASSSVTLTAGGANTYSWMPAGGTTSLTTVTPTTSTIYTVTGTSLGCSATGTVSINVTPTPTITASATPSVICSGATTSLVAIGNAATYTWSPIGVFTASTTATPTVSTTYSVTGLALGCTTTRTVSVTVNKVPTITITPSSTICPTNSITLTAAGTSTAFAWSNGATTATTVVAPTVNTVYTFTGTNTCGTSTATTMVSLGTTPIVSAASSASLICAGNAAVLTASGTATSYSWSTGATSASISVTPTITTLYIAYGINACGTTTATVIQNVSACTGINELTGGIDVSIYPNPATEYVIITIPESIASNNTVVEVTDALGKVVLKETLNTTDTTIKLNKLQDGVYFFKVTSNNQMIKIGKVAKQ